MIGRSKSASYQGFFLYVIKECLVWSVSLLSISCSEQKCLRKLCFAWQWEKYLSKHSVTFAYDMINLHTIISENWNDSIYQKDVCFYVNHFKPKKINFSEIQNGALTLACKLVDDKTMHVLDWIIQGHVKKFVWDFNINSMKYWGYISKKILCSQNKYKKVDCQSLF